MTSSSPSHHEHEQEHGNHVPIRRTASESDISSMSRCSGGTKSSMSGELPEGIGPSHLRNGFECGSPVSLHSSSSKSSEVASSRFGSKSGQHSAAEGLIGSNIDSGDGVAASSNAASIENLDASLPSLGARLHAAGTCQPCLFVLRGNCTEGRSCGYCHMHDEAYKKTTVKRPSKKVRERRQQRAVQDFSEGTDCSNHAPLPPGPVNPVTPGLRRPVIPGPVAAQSRCRDLIWRDDGLLWSRHVPGLAYQHHLA